MTLYRITFDGIARYVEAESMEAAIALWREEWRRELVEDNENPEDWLEDPESCELLTHEPHRTASLRASDLEGAPTP